MAKLLDNYTGEVIDVGDMDENAAQTWATSMDQYRAGVDPNRVSPMGIAQMLATPMLSQATTRTVAPRETYSNGGAVVGLGLKGATALIDVQQRRNESAAILAQRENERREMLAQRERESVAQMTQQEKDRQAQLQYQTLQFRNSEKDRKLREDLAKSEADRREKEAEADRTWRDSDREDRQVDAAERMRIQQEAMLARQQASIAASRVGPPAVLLGVDKTGAKVYAHGGRTYAMLPDGTMEFRDATPNAPGNAQLVYEKDEFGDATGNVYVVRTAPDGSQYQELLPKGPPTATGAPPPPPAPVQDVYPQTYQILRELAATGEPQAVAQLNDMDARLASGAARIVGTQPAQAPGAPQLAPQPVAEVPVPEVPPPPKYPLSPKVVVSESPKPMAPVSFGGMRDALRGGPQQQPPPMTEAEFRAREANAGQPWAVQGGWRPVSDPNDLGRAGVDPNVPVAPAPAPAPTPANWPEGVPLPGTVIDGYEIVVGADGRPAKRKVQ